MKVFGIILAGLVVIAGLCIGGWQLGWWLNNSAVNHQAKIYQNGYGAQSAYIEQARNGISQIDAIQSQMSDPSTPASEQASLSAQKQALVQQTCALAQNITITPPADIVSFVQANCLGGTS
jgi:hypothetical protein